MVAAGVPFCPRCGRFVPDRPAPLVWVATLPFPPPAPRPPRPRYGGAPRYRFVPRWGFPALPWAPPEPAAPEPADPVQEARASLGALLPVLWAVVAASAVAAGGEVWRYVLLLASRADALDARTVMASDALVTAAGTVAPVLALLAGSLLVRWCVLASRAAGRAAGVTPARSGREIVVGWVVPGLNLAVPGSVLAEIEHSALGRPPAARPSPSRLLTVWWVLWGAGVVLAAVTLLWSLRTGVQARADGVLLHAWADLLAAVTAATTVVLVVRLTRMLAPARATRREVLVAVGGRAGRTAAAGTV